MNEPSEIEKSIDSMVLKNNKTTADILLNGNSLSVTVGGGNASIFYLNNFIEDAELIFMSSSPNGTVFFKKLRQTFPLTIDQARKLISVFGRDNYIRMSVARTIKTIQVLPYILFATTLATGYLRGMLTQYDYAWLLASFIFIVFLLFARKNQTLSILRMVVYSSFFYMILWNILGIPSGKWKFTASVSIFFLFLIFVNNQKRKLLERLGTPSN